MYLIASDSNRVVSTAVQVLNSGKVVAYVYYDSKPRSYEDCVRYGNSTHYSSLLVFFNYYLDIYEKVSIFSHSPLCS